MLLLYYYYGKKKVREPVVHVHAIISGHTSDVTSFAHAHVRVLTLFFLIINIIILFSYNIFNK
jgi:hypothetical protein